MITKKITINFLGVEITSAYTRGEHNYKGTISKRKFNECWKAALETFVSTKLPWETNVSMEQATQYIVAGCPPLKSKRLGMTKFFEKRIDGIRRTESFHLHIEFTDFPDEKTADVSLSHNVLDWLFNESAQIHGNALRISHEHEKLETARYPLISNK